MSNELTCVWQTGTDCDGEVAEEMIFSGQLKVPMCTGHKKEHIKIMLLQKLDTDIEEVIELTSEERQEKIEAALGGVDVFDVNFRRSVLEKLEITAVSDEEVNKAFNERVL